MPDDLETLFEKLEPPPGGAVRFHRRLKNEPRRRTRAVAALGLAGVVALAGLLVTVHPALATSWPSRAAASSRPVSGCKQARNRSVSTNVLPHPAPADSATEVPRAVTAARC